MRFVLLALLVLTAGLLPACRGDQDTRDAEDAVRLRLEQDSRGEYAEVWQTLHPAHQAIVTQEKFIECGRELALVRDTTIDSIEILNARQQTRDVPEIGEVEVVTVEAELRTGENSRRPMFDVIEVDDTWRWVMSEAALRAFGAGTCPA